MYDPGGRLSSKLYSNGTVANFTYNADNTLKQLINKSGATLISQHDYLYDNFGNRQQHTEKVGPTDPGRTYNYIYDELNRLTAVNDASSQLLSGTSYDYLNNRSTKTEAGSTLYYNYDAANQLNNVRSGSSTGPVLTSLLYDNNGNMTNRTDERM